MTDEEKEVQKFNEWRLTELSALEAALISDGVQLGGKGSRQRPTSTPPDQAKFPNRASSVPPQSDTAKAKEEAKKELECKGHG